MANGPHQTLILDDKGCHDNSRHEVINLDSRLPCDKCRLLLVRASLGVMWRSWCLCDVCGVSFYPKIITNLLRGLWGNDRVWGDWGANLDNRVWSCKSDYCKGSSLPIILQLIAKNIKIFLLDMTKEMLCFGSHDRPCEILPDPQQFFPFFEDFFPLFIILSRLNF